MHSYHNVAELRLIRGSFSDARSAPGAVHRDIQIADLLAQRVAVEPKKIGGADLVAAGRRQRRGEQRHLDFTQDAVIEARGRDAVRERSEERRVGKEWRGR